MAASERVLGSCLPEDNPFHIVTKTPRFEGVTGTTGSRLLKQAFRRSLKQMGQESVYGLLIHNSDDLLSMHGKALWDTMRELRDSGFIEKIGVSVYSPGQVDAVLDNYPIDLIQLPLNVLDQRMVQKGCLKQLKDRNVEIHSRSAFLQGLLLMDPESLGEHFTPARKVLLAYHDRLKSEGISPAQAALGFVRGICEIDIVIVGVNNAVQLTELCGFFKNSTIESEMDFSAFAIEDETIVNPGFWN